MHEASLYERNCFLTLTYDREHVPSDGSLNKTHFQLFVKRLRKRFGPGIRYYHCGEYGEQLGRPHYHALLFNHDFSDKKFFSVRNDLPLYTSDALSELWPSGFSTVGSVTFESAAYVARYVMKKVTGARAVDHYQGRQPEYTTMSRRPGIGARWYAQFKGDVYPRDKVIVRGVPSRPPRFYDGLLGREDPALLALLKITRERNSQRFVEDVLSDGRMVKVSDSDGQRLLVRETVKLAEISTLKRPLEITHEG